MSGVKASQGAAFSRIMGIGGYRLLRALGFDIETYHMNEGHSALLVLELLHGHRRTNGVQSGGQSVGANCCKCMCICGKSKRDGERLAHLTSAATGG